MGRDRENVAVNAARAAAALLVVASHARALTIVDHAEARVGTFERLLYVPTSLGAEAVTVFFVLSGYWVGGAALRANQQGRFSWRAYMVARLSRLWLVLAPAILLTYVFDVAGFHLSGGSDVYQGDARYHNVPEPGIADRHGVGVALGNILFQQGIHVPVFGSNGPLWSLAYEAAYYLLFPAALRAIMGRGWKSRSANGLLFLAGALLAGSAVLTYFPIWLMGVAAFVLNQRIRVAAKGSAQILASLTLFGAMVASRLVGSAGLWVDFAIAVAAVGLLLAVQEDISGSPWLLKPVRALSRIAPWSYSLYAIHCPLVIFVVACVMPRAEDRLQPGWPAMALITGLVLCSSLAAWGFAQVTEAQTERIRGAVGRFGVSSRPAAGPDVAASNSRSLSLPDPVAEVRSRP